IGTSAFSYLKNPLSLCYTLHMRSNGGGYTIVEVMIFLAISSLLFVAASIAIGGQQAHTEFNTAANDTNTKFQQWIDQVANGFTSSTASGLPSNVTCATSSGR